MKKKKSDYSVWGETSAVKTTGVFFCRVAAKPVSRLLGS